MKQYELAAKANVSVSYLSEVMNAKGNPSLETIAALAEALGASVVVLLQSPSEACSDVDIGSVETSREGLPPGFQRVSATVTDVQAFQVSKWDSAARTRSSASRLTETSAR